MLDIKFIRENTALVKDAILKKHINYDLDELLRIDAELLGLKVKEQDYNTKKNAVSKKIPKASKEQRPELIAEGKVIGEKINIIKPLLKELEGKFLQMILKVPNIPSPLAPLGKDESDNVEIKRFGELPQFDFKALDHMQLLDQNEWADFEKVSKVCGSRSYSLRNEMVLLEMAMHRLAFDILMQKGFDLRSMPSMVREAALVGTGHFPSGRDQVYHIDDDDLYLSGTAEVQINSLHAGDILNEADLPLLYAGYSPCFRSEAGSYGRDVRGLIRVHQFQKVEQYIICKNDDDESAKWHQTLLETSEQIVQDLELPYRIVECCTGDMGTGKVRMFDIESWVPSENTYRETHSCSSLHDWQARRTKTRYRNSEGKVLYCHTLNNTAIATPRIMVSFLENHQRADGSISIPTKLRPYLAGAEALVSKRVKKV